MTLVENPEFSRAAAFAINSIEGRKLTFEQRDKIRQEVVKASSFDDLSNEVRAFILRNQV